MTRLIGHTLGRGWARKAIEHALGGNSGLRASARAIIQHGDCGIPDDSALRNHLRPSLVCRTRCSSAASASRAVPRVGF
jgi:hypothetical protein